ncbi:hypothetical protein [Acinetobacter larvae]|uniref:Uncharacterized protein n=1 Tax=Acinetobacter larvae TaxID=1789224 RepID=A0A1B2LZP8_9GAMM|nr:hypothetical protein [Acinetobacter larvae]AOA58253.1 hypothetical protein BFG52_07725 [Acinetobacter larvae]
MSLEKKSIHVRIEVDMHSRLSVLADLDENEIAAQAAIFLEMMIMAKWHVVNVTAKKMNRLGLTGNQGDVRDLRVLGK